MRRWERIQQAHRLHQTGWTSLAIASEMGIHPKTVRRYLRTTDLQPVKRRNRRRLLDPYKPYLHQRWQEGCQRGVTLYSEIKAQGYPGGLTQLRDYLRTLKENEVGSVGVQSEFASKWHRLSLRRLAFVIGRPETDRQEKLWLVEGLSRLRKGDPMLAETIDLAREFTQAVVSQDVVRFDDWLKRAKVAKAMPLRRFALGLEADLPAVRAALRLKWSNGPVEGKINRLKMLKRQMNGRANLDLLKIRLIGAQPP